MQYGLLDGFQSIPDFRKRWLCHAIRDTRFTQTYAEPFPGELARRSALVVPYIKVVRLVREQRFSLSLISRDNQPLIPLLPNTAPKLLSPKPSRQSKAPGLGA